MKHLKIISLIINVIDYLLKSSIKIVYDFIVFISKNPMASMFILIVNLSELTYLPLFDVEWFNINGHSYILSDILYYNICQIGYISFLPSIILYKTTKNIDSKGLYLGLVIWNFIELLQELNMTLKFPVNLLSKFEMNEITIMQIIFINFTIVFTYIAFMKWNTSCRSL